jgi:hypothetical protein
MDYGAVDSAVIALLGNDPTLKGLCPDGVFFSMAPQAARRFVVISVTDHENIPMFEGGIAFGRFEYLIKAVIFSTSSSDARKAGTQIDALLMNGEAALAPVGFKVARCQCANYRRYSEPDVNPDQRWQHDGGEYAIDVMPLTT